MKYVHYITLRLELRFTGESAEQPPLDLNGITPNQPRPVFEIELGEGVMRLPMTSRQDLV